MTGWRERANLEKKPSMRLSQEPCLGVNVKSKRPAGCVSSQALFFLARPTPGLSKLGEGQNSQMPVGAPLFLSAVRETQFNLPRLLDDTPHRSS